LTLARHKQLTKEGRLEESLEEHRVIMDAFEKGDAKKAGKAMHAHLCNQEKALRD